VDNTIKHKPLYKQQDTDKYSCSGIYKLKCKECNTVYISEMGRSFMAHYAEHISDIKHKRDKSKYAKHILDHLHEYGTKEETMDIIKVRIKAAIWMPMKSSTFINIIE
jgi:hypothetical protein